MGTKLTHNGFEMDITDDLMRQIRDGLDRSTTQILDLMQSEADRLGNQARDLMPIKTGQARDSVKWHAEIDLSGVIRARVIVATKVRYIRSPQIAFKKHPEWYWDHLEGKTQTIRNWDASLTPFMGEYFTMEGRKDPIPDPQKRWRRSMVLAAELKKIGSKAHKQGAAMWLLVRWPEKDSAKNRIEPVIEPILRQQFLETFADGE